MTVQYLRPLKLFILTTSLYSVVEDYLGLIIERKYSRFVSGGLTVKDEMSLVLGVCWRSKYGWGRPVYSPHCCCGLILR